MGQRNTIGQRRNTTKKKKGKETPQERYSTRQSKSSAKNKQKQKTTKAVPVRNSVRNASHGRNTRSR
jgi:hypothetical protein